MTPLLAIGPAPLALDALVALVTLVAIVGEWWLVAEPGDRFNWQALRSAWFDLPIILLGGAWLAQPRGPGMFARNRVPIISATPTPLLHERNFGVLRGRSYDSLGFDPLATDDAPPGGESVVEFRERVGRAFAELLAASAALEGPLVAVTHGLVIRTMLEMHVRLPEGQALPASLANTSCTVFEVAEPYAVSLLNCVRHLDASVRDDGRGLSGF